MLRIKKIKQVGRQFVIIALGRLRQENFFKVKVSLEYIVRSCKRLNKTL